MKPTTGITLPASFVVTVSPAGTGILRTAPADNDILTVAEVAELLLCNDSDRRGPRRTGKEARVSQHGGVFDVYTKSQGTALDGTKYKDW